MIILRHDVLPGFVQSLLRSLRHIHVDVEPLPEAVEAAGLSVEMVEQRIAADLDEAPISLISEVGILHFTGHPTLHLHIAVSDSESEVWPYSISVELREVVHPERLDDLRVSAPTWRIAALGVVRADAVASLQDDVAVLVGEFSTALQEAKHEQNDNERSTPV
jgi:hypothetical protein